MEDKIRLIINKAIDEKVFPGAVFLFGTSQKIEYLQSFGTTKYNDPGTKSVTADTIYDIASLTKLFTTTAALILIDRGKFKLDTKVSSLLPEFSGGEKNSVTIWNLLTHTAGLHFSMKSLKDFPSTEIRHKILSRPLNFKPGTQAHYSNPNSMLLAEVITVVSGKKFIDFLKNEVIDPLKLSNTQFHPAKRLLSRIAPTEKDSWRMRLIHGEVHDESAYAMGGIAGHAGLFSTAEDLWKFCLMWLNGGLIGGKRILEKETVDRATSRQVKDEDGWIGLGWRIDNPKITDHAPWGTYGHTGFTGTSVIVSPRKNKILILLSNRIYPQRKDVSSIQSVRNQLTDLVLNHTK